jgi:NDP-sugar pyrophosphorylase family protein
MNVSDLFVAQMEPEFTGWLNRFSSPVDLFLSMHELYSKLHSSRVEGVVEEGALIIGPVHVGVGSTVQSQAIIRGPAIIGTDTVIHSHADIQPGSFIGSGCSIKHCCFVSSSVIMNKTAVWPSAFIKNSIIGYGVIIGPGVVLGDDTTQSTRGASGIVGAVVGDNVAVGANSTIRAGSVIGRGAIVAEASLVRGIYKPNQGAPFGSGE